MSRDRDRSGRDQEVSLGEEPERLRARPIKVWFCDECGYWREEKSTGKHVTTDPDNPTGRLLTHALSEVEFVPLAEVERLAGERDDFQGRVAMLEAAAGILKERNERLAGRVAALEAENKLLAAALNASNNALLDVGGSE